MRGTTFSVITNNNVQVRKTTIRVLTNLILNDMVKVKGQISELAVCLEDKEAHIRWVVVWDRFGALRESPPSGRGWSN